VIDRLASGPGFDFFDDYTGTISVANILSHLKRGKRKAKS
jgi:hypothetical protein